jgi:ribosomal protein S18 acetylase RimI-like enzyme
MIRLTELLRIRGQKVYPIAADLYEELEDRDVQVTVRLWEDEHRNLLGFAYINRYQNLVDVFDASIFTQDIESQMMDWIVSAARQRNQKRGVTLTLDASCSQNDQQRLLFLERHGFARQTDSSLLLARSLLDPLPAVLLPSGYSIRPMRGTAEIETYVSLHRAAFGTDIMTISYRQSIMNSPNYIPEIDLLAVTPDGSLAAFCMCQIFPDDEPRAGGQKEGWTDPVGTHPAHRRQGLAQALIITGMHVLQERGIDTALLGTSSTNEAMLHTAEKIGYRSVSTTLWLAKVV